jgi:hypothetical protein
MFMQKSSTVNTEADKKNEIQLSLPIRGVFLLKYSLVGQLKNLSQQNIKYKRYT